MPRGAKPKGPPTRLTAAPRGENDPNALIDAAWHGWARDARVRVIWPGPQARGSWIDSANHPKDPHQNFRPPDHYWPLIRQAVAALRSQGLKQYQAHKHVADRLLSLHQPDGEVLPSKRTIEVLAIPPHALGNKTGDARFAAARTWVMRKLKSACR